MQVIVIGGGIIGVLSAYYLAKAGYKVAVFERNEDVGAEASRANGAQLSYTYVSPLASPDIWSLMPKVLFGKDKSIRINKWMDPRLWGWITQLLMNSPAAVHNANQNNLLNLALKSEFFMQRFIETNNIEFDYKNNGKLHLFEDEPGFEKMKMLADKLEKHQIYQRILSPEECIAQEPALKHREGSLVGGIFSQRDSVGDCEKFVNGLRKYLEERYGVEFKTGEKVQKIIRKHHTIHAIQTERSIYSARVYVVATGAGATRLLSPLGIHAPIYPVKGYSLSVPKAAAGIKLDANITDHAKKMVFAPVGDRIKIGGFMHFEKLDKSLSDEALSNLKKSALEVFPKLNLQGADYFAGFRPYTPNSNPIVKRTQYHNLYVNIGHGMLGWTLSHATSQALSRLIIDDLEFEQRQII